MTVPQILASQLQSVSLFRNMESISLRAASLEDAQALYAWATDEEVRRWSFNTRGFSYESHVEWLSEKLNNSDQMQILMANIGADQIGYIRFERLSPDMAEVSFALAGLWRGQGLGTRLLTIGISHIKEIWTGLIAIQGKVKPGNVASEKLFEKLAFDRSQGDTATVFLRKI
ncbi:MAG: RimJ/RimL family protein N-acetyltransferase [Candidatus Marinamargulisbacteria bacterium]|jgi:RimJ/RimL family protein N-acetyltransferase